MDPTILAWPNLEKSGNTKLAWLWLWCEEANNREGVIITSAAALGAALGTTDRAARRMLENLETLKAMQILERNVSGKGRLRGQVRVFVHNPKSVIQSQPPGIEPDPQRPLIPDAIDPRIRPAHPAILAPKPPATLAPKPPDGEPPRTLQTQPATRFGCGDRLTDPAILAPKPPDPLNEFKEEREFSLPPKPHRIVRSNEFNEGPRAEETCPGREPAHISAALTETFQAATRYLDNARPIEQKGRLRKRILEAAGIEDSGWWVAGAGADLVVSHGFAIEKMEALLGELVRRRHLPTENRNHIHNPGGWLQKRLAEIARECGMKWGRAKQ